MAERRAWMRHSAWLVSLTALQLLPQFLSAQEKHSDETDEKVYDLSPDMTPPRVTKQVAPRYATAKGVRVEGAVTVALVVSSEGVPRDVRVLKGLDKDVDQSAVDAVREWRFAPARKNDKPIAVRVSLEIEFHSM